MAFVAGLSAAFGEEEGDIELDCVFFCVVVYDGALGER
jgi:hypothetical protein